MSDKWIERGRMIDHLRQYEAYAVTIVSDNADAGPNSAIILNGDATNYNDRYYHGETVEACLAAAVIDFDTFEKAQDRGTNTHVGFND